MPQTGEQATARRWGFLLAEMFLIVASILLAFALDSWWDERQDRAEEQEILQGLSKEFQEIRAVLKGSVEVHETVLSAMEELYLAAQRGSWTNDAKRLDRSLVALIDPPTTDLGTGVLDALISSGRMELLSNRTLRARLAGWEAVYMEVLDDELMWRDFVFDKVVPHLISHGVPMSGPLSLWPGMWRQSTRSLGDDPESVARLLSDPQFVTLLELRIGFKMHLNAEYAAAAEAANEILAEIDRSRVD